MVKKILIANRSEIALRVMRTARDIGIKTVAVYTDVDRNSLYVNQADEAYHIEGATFQDTFLNADMILNIAQKSGADAIHPGYGFLSENAEFVRLATNSGLVWIGPSADAIDALGDKVRARKVAEQANVSPVPGISEFLKSAETVREFIQKYNYPVILKRADGGGGQGITVVRTDSELENFLTAHTHDINYYFIERFVENARHVETQAARDAHGNFAIFSTRDCSVQRRNQKLIEEAPAPFLQTETVNQLYAWSKALFETVDYVGVGTCEFLVETLPDKSQVIYFLEVNPRIQVEHTITEEVSGIDLVEQQIRIASGQPLSSSGNLALENRGHSIEMRITSENPYDNMTPTGGKITELTWPFGHGVRLEPGIALGDEVSTAYDSMVAKIIITAPDRARAIARCLRALQEFAVTGISTPKELYNRILSDSDFVGNPEFNISTKWLENKILPEFNAQEDVPTATTETNSTATTGQFKTFTVEIDGKRTVLGLPDELYAALSSAGQPAYNTSGRQPIRRSNSSLLGRRNLTSGNTTDSSNSDSPDIVASPMQGIVVSIAVQQGQQVQVGDLVVVLEAMKMEKFITATADGIVEEILVNVSDSVVQNQSLVRLALD
jgi:acetyl-CoA/propionyl-CoA carboxylase biotin carboxyl carrier protein